jgi:DNA-directed RNA polymerase specialized sigma24 family protein/ribosome-associated translation inhibitor RaiA
MSFHWVFNKCTSGVKSALEEYWKEKWPRLEKLLTPSYAPELQEVRLTVTCHEQSPQRRWYDIHGVIHLPTGTLAAKSHDKDPRTALDDVVDLLAAEIKRHKERVRKDYIFKRKVRPHNNISAAGPQTVRRPIPDDRARFMRLIRPLLPSLRDHIRRELNVLELENVVHRNELSVTELMDEVLARAWQHFAEYPRKQPIKNWLVDILHDTLEDLIKQEPRPHESMEEQVDETLPSEEPQVDEQEWWEWLVGYEDPLELGDYIARLKDAGIGERFDSADDLNHIFSLVSELLPPLQRQAFILNVLEEFDPFEIAIIQNRRESEVWDDIEMAKILLRRRLREEHMDHTSATTGSSSAGSRGAENST